MRLKIYLLLLIVATAGCETADSNKSPVDYVNPFVGTGGHGHTFPGATLPFGMVQLSPDTRLSGWDGCGGYHYTDSIVYGFSHTHLQGTGISDYGDVLFMPTGSTPEFINQVETNDDQGYCAVFDKNSELASPGYYSVQLQNPDIKVELSATLRTGIHKYSSNLKGKQYVTLDLEHRDKLLDWKLQLVNDREIQGYRISSEWAKEQHLYFVARFSQPITALLQDSIGKIESPDTTLKAIFSLEFAEMSDLLIKVGISAVDMDGARKNLDAEAVSDDFNSYKTNAEAAWLEELNKIKIKGGSEEERSLFYTSLYHAFVAPNLFSDSDGRYRGTDMQIHENPGHPVYTVFSLWDTFRAAQPLYSLVQPERNADFIKTFLLQYEQGGELPMWELAANETHCMIGYHSVPAILDAWVNGIQDFDTALALQGMIATATKDELGKSVYSEKGFIGMEDEAESVSKTLEYAYDDWCIARFAQLTGQDAVVDRFYSRSQFYRNLFDPETKFMRARRNGGWASPFEPAEVNFNFTEANSWQYSFFVPHDVQGLIDLHGGAAGFEKKLDELFSTSSELMGRSQPDITGLIGQYAHGNEPSHHMAYLYHYVGKPEKSAQMVHEILKTQYSNLPEGLSGNEDCGQMSAWYVLSAMGIYPVCPGSGELLLIPSIFDEIEIQVSKDKFSKITKEGKGDFISSVKWNDADNLSLFLKNEDLKSGKTLSIHCAESSSKNDWHIPTSIGTKFNTSASPAIVSEKQVFTDSLQIKLTHCSSNAEIFYRIGSTEWQLYKGPFYIREDATIEAYGKEPDRTESQLIAATFYKLDQLWSVRLMSEYDNQYTGGGPQGLCDRLTGGQEFRNGLWQGYYGKDFEAVIDLGNNQKVHAVSAGFLQDIRPWIWLPASVEFSYSTNGNDFKSIGKTKPDIAIDDYTVQRKELGITCNVSARYIKIKAESFGVIPGWHLGHGNPSWIFVDEVIIE